MNECKLHGHTNTKRRKNYTRKKNWHYIEETLQVLKHVNQIVECEMHNSVDSSQRSRHSDVHVTPSL